MLPAEGAQQSVEKGFGGLEQQGRSDVVREGFSPGQVSIERFLDLRYVGQSYEIVVPFDATVTEAVASFHAAHERQFGYNSPRERVQVVNVRVKAHSRPPGPVLEQKAVAKRPTLTPKIHRPVIFNINAATTQDTALYAREALTPGLSVELPAIVTQYHTTTVLPPGWQTTVS